MAETEMVERLARAICFHHTYAHEARAAIEAIITGWQPMETAPRDGTRVLLSRHPEIVRNGKLVVIGEYTCTGSRRWNIGNGQYVRCERFNGWMPLPAPTDKE